MMKLIYIFCFTLLAIFSPKLTIACSEHQEQVETECKTTQPHEEANPSCDENALDHTHHQSDNSCGESNTCCCPIMANNFCCIFLSTIFEFDFYILQPKEEISTKLVFHLTPGFSSIFIPPKIV